MAVIDLSTQTWNLKSFMQLVKEGSDIDLTVDDETEAKSLKVLSKFRTGQDTFDESCLKHIHLGFVIACSVRYVKDWCDFDAINTTIVDCGDVPAIIIVASGTLLEWKQTIVEGLQKHRPLELRKDLQTIVQSLDHRGYGRVFRDYSRHMDRKVLYLQ